MFLLSIMDYDFEGEFSYLNQTYASVNFRLEREVYEIEGNKHGIPVSLEKRRDAVDVLARCCEGFLNRMPNDLKTSDRKRVLSTLEVIGGLLRRNPDELRASKRGGHIVEVIDKLFEKDPACIFIS